MRNCFVSTFVLFCLMVSSAGCGVKPNTEDSLPFKQICHNEPKLDGRGLGTEVFGGALDLINHPAVMMVRTRFGVCSGTLVSPYRVLTAAHCACTHGASNTRAEWIERIEAKDCRGETATVYPDWNGPRCTNSFNPPTGTTTVMGRVILHRDLLLVQGDVEQDSHDMAIIILERPIENITPVEIAATSIWPLTIVTVVGFGLSDDYYSGTRREGKMYVTKVTANILETAPLARGTRVIPGSGDSGGALLWRDEYDVEKLVGITVYSNEIDLSGFTNAPTYRDWIEGKSSASLDYSAPHGDLPDSGAPHD